MNTIPDDIYTEQDADPDTLANLGPLRRLAGTWRGKIGKDVNPKADGITALPPGKPDMDNMRFFTAPRFEDGGSTAELAFITKLVGRDARGRPLPPYIDQVNLTVRKIDGTWTLVEQKQGPVT